MVPDWTDAQVAAAWADFTPVSTGASDWPVLPPELRDHAIHIRDFGRLTAEQLTSATEVQVRHVLRDVCRALALLVDKRLD
jgi:hypothetical protein